KPTKRQCKMQLIEENNSDWNDLYDEMTRLAIISTTGLLF
ncbi:MAG: hypothetical protein ACJARD_001695, partial [Alphaproteobacteria bacterium]